MQHWVYAGIHLHVHLPAVHAYTYCNRFRHCDTDTQTNAHSESAYDAEAATDSATEAVGPERNRRCCVVGILDRQTGRCGRRGAVYSSANS
jgi:hypothetical protein